METVEVPVLIVGGSLVGMTAALMLAHHGIPALTVEHHRGTAIHPRAAMITQRSLEVLRTVGIEQIVRERSQGQFDQDGAIMAVETLAGKELAWFIPNINEGVRDLSPTVRLFITQSLLEPLMKQRADELGANLRFSTEMLSFEQDADGVTAHLKHRDTGAETRVRAQYMVAADGGRSRVRDALAIPFVGHGTLSKSITIYFRGDIAPLIRGRNLSVILVRNASLRGFFRIEKPYQSGFLVVNTVGDPAHPMEDVWDGLTDERCLEYLRTALGVPAIDVAIDSVMRWQSVADTAEHFREGRVFLAGDAAHCMPPYGGYGGNTGMQDAHNLAWKFAAVIKGWTGPELLDTYEPERRPVGVLTTEQSYTRYATREATYLGKENMQPLVDDLNIEFGYRYPGLGDEAAGHENPRKSHGKPGTRAPHLWLRDGQSTLDLFDLNPVLLATSDVWINAAKQAASKLEVPVDFHRITAEGFSETYGLSPAGCVLVRPDGFVAWRSQGPAADNDAESVEQALRSMLHRQ